MRIKNYDVVELIADISGLSLVRGMRGTVLIVFNEPGLPLAYEIEFIDKEGNTIALETLSHDIVRKVKANEDV